MKLETQLLIFNGFYGTNLGEYLEDRIDDSEYESIDWKSTYEDIATEFFDLFVATEGVSEILVKFGIKLQYKELWSPRFYNYHNDRIYMTVTYDPNTLSEKVFKDKYYDSLVEILKNEFTSGPGFTSFYSNDTKDIEKYLSDMNDEIILSYVIYWLLEDIDFSHIEEIILERYYEFLEYEAENEKV